MTTKCTNRSKGTVGQRESSRLWFPVPFIVDQERVPTSVRFPDVSNLLRFTPFSFSFFILSGCRETETRLRNDNDEGPYSTTFKSNKDSVGTFAIFVVKDQVDDDGETGHLTDFQYGYIKTVNIVKHFSLKGRRRNPTGHLVIIYNGGYQNDRCRCVDGSETQSRQV